MNDHQEARNAAKAFATEHIKELAEEILEWKKTAILRDGRLREMAVITAHIDPGYALQLAESFVVNAALEAAARNP